MYVLMQCVAEAVVAKGVRGLAELVPGGGFLYDVANEAHKRLRDRQRSDEIRAEVVSVAAAGIDEVRKVAQQVVKEVAKNATPSEKAALELYLTQVPGAVRASFRRAEDPSGKSVPDQFALADGNDLARRLPSRLPKFRPGDALPGRPGWVVGELLGSGGFGEVWLARNPSLAALKGAVKFGTDPQARERLLRHEGGLVSRVMEEGRHPNIVPLLDAYLDGDTPWLMYEYVSGGELGNLIGAWQVLTPADRIARTVNSLRTLAAAVGHFHRLSPPLVHRDLKPANILVRGSSAAPQLLVADFGIGGVAADAALAAETSRRSSGYLGSQLWGSHTPLYASPQQQRGEKPDPRDDVHALGVIGYQMLTGKLDTAPGADFARTLRRLNVPEPFIELLGDCAAHDPDNRPRDAAELADRLTKLDTPGVAAPPAPAEAPQIVGCPSCRVSLRFRAGATALRCVKCGTVFNPSEAQTPAPPPPIVEARPAPQTVRPGPTTRRARDDDDRDRDRRRERDRERERDRDRDREHDRERDRDRECDPESRSRVWTQVLWIGGTVVGAVVFFIVLAVVLRDRGTGTPPSPPVASAGGATTPPAPSVPPIQSGGSGFTPIPTPPPSIPGFPTVPRPKVDDDFPPPVKVPKTTPGKTRPPRTGPDPTVGQLRTFTSPSLAKDAEVRYTPDGQMLLAVTPGGDVSLVSAVDGTVRLAYASGVKGFRPAVYADGQAVKVVTALDGKKGVYVVDAATGVTKKLPPLPRFDDVPTAAAVSRNKEWVAAGGDGGAVVVWKTQGTGVPYVFYGPGGSKAFPSRVDAMAFSDHIFPELLAASGNTVREWQSFGDWKSQGPRTLVADGPVFALLPVPRHRGVVAGVTTRGVAFWEAGSTAGVGASPAAGGIKSFTRAAVGASTFDLDYAALGADGKFGFWDTVRTKPITPELDQPPAADLDFSKDGKLLAVAHADGSVGIWHAGERRGATSTPKQAVQITDHGGPVVSVTWSPDGKELATVDRTGRVRVWADLKVDYPTGDPFQMKAP